MTPSDFLTTVLMPGIAWCQTIPGWRAPFNDRAILELTAISGQEANWTDRIQSGNGPAHGLFQFERRGGVAGVLGDIATNPMAIAACRAAGVATNSTAVWGAFATAAGDHLSVAFARLLLWSDPSPLPAVGDEEGGWIAYQINWRPGAPSRERWSTVYPQAMAATGFNP
jgi:hypothetical protein